MPLTFSHPAAVLPLNYLPKKYISLTGLVFGSMVPDFEYFIRLRDASRYSHKWIGMFWFDLPLAIILAFIFHGMVRNALIDNSPLILRKRLMRFKDFSWTDRFQKSFLIIIISILIGTVSHIVWDGVTHVRGQFVREYLMLRHTFVIAGHRIPTYELLWNLGTLAGGLIVIYGIFQLPVDRSVNQKRNIFPYWICVGVITALVTAIRCLFAPKDFDYFEDLIVTIIAAWMLGLIFTPKILPTKYL